MHRLILFPLLILLLILLPACATAPDPTRSGFLSAYDALDEANPHVSPAIHDAHALLIEPVEIRIEDSPLSEADAAEAAAYLRAAAERIAAEFGIPLTDEPAPGVARLRMAITGVTGSTWWQKLHPAARIAGAGTGGAAMEAEILDALSGEQLAAAALADTGNNLNPTAFSTLDDVKGAIDKWADEAAARLQAERAEP